MRTQQQCYCLCLLVQLPLKFGTSALKNLNQLPIDPLLFLVHLPCLDGCHDTSNDDSDAFNDDAKSVYDKDNDCDHDDDDVVVGNHDAVVGNDDAVVVDSYFLLLLLLLL